MAETFQPSGREGERKGERKGKNLVWFYISTNENNFFENVKNILFF